MNETPEKQGTSWLSIVLLVGGGLVAAALLFPVFGREHSGGRGPSCQTNLKQIGLAFLQYAQDNDKLPPRRVTPRHGWVEVIYPYTKWHPLFYCPSAATQGSDDPTQRNYTDYWFNPQLRKQGLEALTAPAFTILSGDGNDGTDLTNANYAISALPPAWLGDTRSPAYRHLESMNLLFADGHVKALKPARIVASPDKGPSFALK